MKIPFDSLVLNPAINVRHSNRDESIAELAESIRALDLLQDIIVREVKTANGHPRFEIVDGERRYMAMKLIRETEPMSFDPLSVIIRYGDESDAREVSLAANIMRLEMTPIDEVEAFGKLAEDGRSVDDIALTFGITARRVQQRIALAKLAPEILSLVRKDEITLAEAQAFTLEPRHERQVKIMRDLGENMSTWSIRRAILDEALAADCGLAEFITEQAYLAAGGTIREDLFGEDRFWESGELIATLLETTIQKTIDAYEDDGWKWVRVDRDADYHGMKMLGAEVAAKVSAEDAAKIEALEAERGRCFSEANAKSDEEHDEAERLHERIRELDTEIETLRGNATFSLEQKARSGVVIQVLKDDVRIFEGCIAAGDRKANRAEDDDSDPSPTSGPGTPAAHDESDLAGAVLADLSLHMGGALQMKLSMLPARAPRLIAAALIMALQRRQFESPLAFDITSFKAPEAMRGHSVFRAEADAFLAPYSEMDFESLVGHLELLAPDDFGQILAVLAAHAVRMDSTGTGPDRQLAKMVSPAADLYWQADEAFLKRLKRPQLLEALADILPTATHEALKEAKKAELVKHCSEHLAGKGWLPPYLRSPAYEGPGSNAWADKVGQTEAAETEEAA
jgi:ParB family transcriptional regulator, chromosome partitioning protein